MENKQAVDAIYELDGKVPVGKAIPSDFPRFCDRDDWRYLGGFVYRPAP